MANQQQKFGIVIAGLLLGILMASMDNTIVSTAMGTIVGKLGGLDKFVWATSAYMIAEMAGMPIFGKLSDMYGRKRFFIFGIAVFMIGSILCGTASSIIELSVYRAIQGIGGGALVPIAFAIMFDAVPPETRGKLVGLFGAVFGMSSIFGPLLGAYITDHINWQWVFWINLPLGILAFIFVAFFYKESHEHSKQRIDWSGALTLVGAIVCLCLALELGGKEYAWDSTMIIGLFAGFAALAVLFVLAELRAAEPIISFRMFTNRLYMTSNAIAIFGSAAFITASMYIPIFIQGVLGGSATNSGLVLLPMMLGSVVTATLGGFAMNKISYRAIMVPASMILVAGCASLSLLSSGSSQFMVTIIMIVIGLGIGASFSVLTNAAIHSFEARQRGSVSSTLNFLRSLGMTIGITVFGIIQNHAFLGKMAPSLAGQGVLPEGLQTGDPHALLDPAQRGQLPANILDHITNALSSSIVHTLAWTVLPAVIALVFAFAMSKEKLDPMPDQPAVAVSH